MLLTKAVLFVYLIWALTETVSSVMKFTNAHCESFNKSWVVVRQCRLRAIKRDVTAFNMNIDVLYPANKINLNVEVLKKTNGYRPFPINFTIDACAFMEKRNNPISNMLFKLFKEYTNVNHTCPYVGEQIIKGFYLRHELFDLPLPYGEYAIFLTWNYHSKRTFVTNLYFTFSKQ